MGTGEAESGDDNGLAIAGGIVGGLLLCGLVAGRLTRKKNNHTKVHGERLIRDTPLEYPDYWTTPTGGLRGDLEAGDFHAFVIDEGAVEEMQRLLDDTFVNAGGGRQSLTGMAKGRLKVQEVKRVEDSKMWRLYLQSRAWIKTARSSSAFAGGLKRKGTLNLEDPPRTTFVLSEEWRNRLMLDLNEAYLFHGTSQAAAESIGETDFRIDLAGHTHGKKLGQGAYFAEASSLAHAYAPPGPDGRQAVLVVRCLLGNVFVSENRAFAWSNKKRDSVNTAQIVGSGEWDSLLGDREKVAGTFREFCVSDKAQLYPEYLVLYTFEE